MTLDDMFGVPGLYVLIDRRGATVVEIAEEDFRCWSLDPRSFKRDNELARELFNPAGILCIVGPFARRNLQ